MVLAVEATNMILLVWHIRPIDLNGSCHRLLEVRISPQAKRTDRLENF